MLLLVSPYRSLQRQLCVTPAKESTSNEDFLEVLEASTIAWPNAAMWRQVALLAPYISHQISPRQNASINDDPEPHAHSPRNAGPPSRPPMQVPKMGIMAAPTILPRASHVSNDPFTEPVHAAYKMWRQVSSDVSMPDYTNSNSRAPNSRQVTDPMVATARPERQFESMQAAGAFETICEALQPKVPTNTPQNQESMPLGTLSNRVPSAKADLYYSKYIRLSKRTALTCSRCDR
jgi:hypothetical protein